MQCSISSLVSKRAARATRAADGPQASRRGVLGLLFLSTCGTPAAVAAPPTPPPAEFQSPYSDAKKMEYGPTPAGAVRKCPGSVNPNCVSTASTNDAYAPAWLANEREPAAACDLLTDALTSLYPETQLVGSNRLADGSEYRRFTVDGLYGKDIIEVIVSRDGVSGRNWEGDSDSGLLVTYRSMAGTVKYFFPITQPLWDLGAQGKRLKALKKSLGWKTVGCELLECYQDDF